jgi:hypothetical protein
MRVIYLACILLLTLFSKGSHAAEFPLLERLEKAHKGDFIVLEAGHTLTLLAIRTITNHTLILEEISAPLSALPKKNPSWSEWVKTKAPGHSSWSMIEIDLDTREILECYSFSSSAWLPLTKEESLIGTLLQLPLDRTPLEQRRRIGPSPMEGEVDRRSLWTPPLFVDGKQLENTLFDVFQAIWPQDGTELAGKTVALYFDIAAHSPLPSWIQIDTPHATASIRAIDSGKGLPSLHRHFPRRIPEFVGAPMKTKEGLRLSLKSPKYYKSFELFAVDVTHREKEIHPLSHSIEVTKEGIVNLYIDTSELSQSLQPDHQYKWLVVPSGHSESYVESMKPFLWNP